MATDKIAPAAQWTTSAPQGLALGRLSLALDPDTGHLYPAPEGGTVAFREDPASGRLTASDEGTRPAARTAVAQGRAIIY